MKNRYDFFEKVSDDLGVHPGFLNKKELTNLLSSNDDTLYTIPFEHTYRPDLISYKFYKNSSLQWVLVYANNIGDSPEGFFTGRQIRVPRFERLINIM